MDECVRYVAYDNAARLLAALRINSSESPIRDASPYQWVFRGHANASWTLLPTAIRPGTRLGFYDDRPVFVSQGCGAATRHMDGEFRALHQFAELADRVGLPVPGLSGLLPFLPFASDEHVVGSQIGTSDWPPRELLELLAIAQHHGVPTRLLDFTFSPLAALFFACGGGDADKNADESGDLAVWALDLKWIRQQPYQFRVVEAQRSSNPFLRAQKGAFVLDRRICDWREDSPTPCLEKRIRDESQNESEGPVLVRFTMPRSETTEALRLLALENIDYAHLMPSFDNVVKALRRFT